MARSFSQFHFSGGWLSNIDDLDDYTHFYNCYNKWAMGESKLVLLITHKGDRVSYKALSWNTTLLNPHNMRYDEPWTRGSWLNFFYNFSCISNFGNYSCLPRKYHPRHSYDRKVASMNTIFITWKLELEWDTKQNEKCLERLWISFCMDNIKFWVTVISYVLKANPKHIIWPLAALKISRIKVGILNNFARNFETHSFFKVT